MHLRISVGSGSPPFGTRLNDISCEIVVQEPELRGSDISVFRWCTRVGCPINSAIGILSHLGSSTQAIDRVEMILCITDALSVIYHTLSSPVRPSYPFSSRRIVYINLLALPHIQQQHHSLSSIFSNHSITLRFPLHIQPYILIY